VRRLGVVLLVMLGITLPAGTAAAALAAPVAAPPGGIGVRLVDVPANSSSDPLARLYIIDRLSPGTSIRRQLEVSNTTQSIADVAVYPAGASFGQDGITFASGHDQDALSSWTSLSRDALRLLPGTEALETVTIDVPKDAPAGEDYSVIWAQVSAPSSTGGSILLVNRVGIRMYVSVGSGGTPAPNFAIGPLSARRSVSGAPLVEATIHNTGPGPLDISGSLTLSSGPGGIRGGPFPVSLGSALAPGGFEVATVTLESGLPIGPWKAAMLLASGPTIRSAAATLTFPRLAAAGPASSGLLLLVLTVLLVLLAGAALVFGLLRRRTRLRSSHGRVRVNGRAALEPSAIGLS
jgi:hypothetical protein